MKDMGSEMLAVVVPHLSLLCRSCRAFSHIFDFIWLFHFVTHNRFRAVRVDWEMLSIEFSLTPKFQSHITASFDEPDIEFYSSWPLFVGLKLFVVRWMKKKENAFAPLVGKAVVCCYFTISYHSHSRCAELPEANSQEKKKTNKTKQIRITKKKFATTCRSQSGCHVSQY